MYTRSSDAAYRLKLWTGSAQETYTGCFSFCIFSSKESSKTVPSCKAVKAISG